MNTIDYLYSKDRVLDFSSCKYLGEVHEIIKTELELPDCYGANLDALWDAVTGLMYVPANIKIIFKPKTKAAEKLGDEIDKIVSIFFEAQEEYNQIKVTVEK
ncbi:MAG: barstar family protein [Acutalibacteraceae bacterium]